MPSADSRSLPSARDFAALSRTHTLVPVYRTVTADLETPVSAFLRIADEEPEAFLLESVEGGEHVGRYTFIGIQPYKKMIARGREIYQHGTPEGVPACSSFRAGLPGTPPPTPSPAIAGSARRRA